MRTRTLAGSPITAVGSGDTSLATSAARGVDAREVERALHQALELGLTLVEVRDESDAERLVGDAVRALRLRDSVVVATRVPALADVPHERLPGGYIQQRVEASLRATRLDVLPLVQLPLRAAWRRSPAWAELADTAARLVREGKVLAWGAILDGAEAGTDDGTDDTKTLLAEPWLASLSVPLSLCARGAESLLPAATERSVAILARQPLAGGALAGQLGPGSKLAPRDDRHVLDPRTLERIAVEAARLAPLVRTTPPAARSCDAAREVLEAGVRPEQLEATTLGELALRYVIDRGAIALPRLHRAEHVPTAVAAAAAPPLSPELVRRMLDERSDE